MSINWNKHKFDIEELAKKGDTNKLISKLCDNYSLDISAMLENLEKDSEDYQYYTALQKALNKVKNQYDIKQTKGAR